MRSKRLTAAEQFQLITQCRQSGLSDAQWCMQNDIKMSSFYNWTSRLKKKGVDIPVPCEPVQRKPDIVQLDFHPTPQPLSIPSDQHAASEIVCSKERITKEVKCAQSVMRLTFDDGFSLDISNDVNAELLS